MCLTRNSRRIRIQDRNIRVDGCIADLILALDKLGIKTLACCCGHGIYPMSVIVKIGGKTRELFSNIEIPRTRNFYKKDENGYYFIPEIARLNPYLPKWDDIDLEPKEEKP